MTEHELKILKTFHPDYDGAGFVWGAWVGVCIVFLQEDGHLTRYGDQIRITQKGLDYLCTVSELT